MRIVSIITALVVMVALYFLILQRDTVLSFARGDNPDEPAVADAKQTETDAKPADGIKRVSVVAMHSKARPVAGAVLVRGRTEAARQVDVRAETSGTVISKPLRKGAMIDENATLCGIDPGTREANLAETVARLAEAKARLPEAEARLAEAESRLVEAEINDRVASQLKEDGFASQTRVAATTASVSSAKASVQSAKSGLDSAQSGISAAEAAVAASKKEIERLTITAPFGGLLETDSAELGEFLQPGAVCATIIQLNPIKLVGFVPEVDVDKISIGSPVHARMTSGLEVEGIVTFLSRSADENTRTFRVEAEVDNTDLSIRDGQTSEIRISSSDAVAHLLPQSSLTLNNDGTIGVRLVDANSEAQFVPITVLRDTVDGIWASGLSEMADIIIVGQEFVTDGVPVAPTFRELGQ